MCSLPSNIPIHIYLCMYFITKDAFISFIYCCLKFYWVATYYKMNGQYLLWQACIKQFIINVTPILDGKWNRKL